MDLLSMAVNDVITGGEETIGKYVYNQLFNYSVPISPCSAVITIRGSVAGPFNTVVAYNVHEYIVNGRSPITVCSVYALSTCT